MGSKIYVGGLPYSTTEQQLSDLFAAHGAVASARIITDKFTGQSRGFGFVEMAVLAEAEEAISGLEAERDALHVAMADPAFYREEASRVVETRSRLDALDSEIAAAYGRWESLEEKLRELSSVEGKG